MNKTKEGWWQVFKFMCFSISAGVVQMGLFALFNELMTWSYWPSYLISVIASIIWNFTFNRHFTFKSANNIPKAMSLVFLYYCIFTPLSLWWGEAMTQAGINEYIVVAFTMVVNFVTEFLYQRFFVFKKSINTNKHAVNNVAYQKFETNKADIISKEESQSNQNTNDDINVA